MAKEHVEMNKWMLGMLIWGVGIAPLKAQEEEGPVGGINTPSGLSDLKSSQQQGPFSEFPWNVQSVLLVTGLNNRARYQDNTLLVVLDEGQKQVFLYGVRGLPIDQKVETLSDISHIVFKALEQIPVGMVAN